MECEWALTMRGSMIDYIPTRRAFARRGGAVFGVDVAHRGGCLGRGLAVVRERPEGGKAGRLESALYADGGSESAREARWRVAQSTSCTDIFPLLSSSAVDGCQLSVCLGSSRDRLPEADAPIQCLPCRLRVSTYSYYAAHIIILLRLLPFINP